MSIKDFKPKIKYFKEYKLKPWWRTFCDNFDVRTDIFVVISIILVGLLGFVLGRISAYEKNMPQVEIVDGLSLNKPDQQSSNDSQLAPTSVIPGQTGIPITPAEVKGLVVAAKTGTKYYYPWCSGVSRISDKNKVWFDTVEAAKTAGYSAASNCSGLK